jgi:hypothetical protein
MLCMVQVFLGMAAVSQPALSMYIANIAIF